MGILSCLKILKNRSVQVFLNCNEFHFICAFMMNCSSQEIQESDTSSEIECFLDLDNEIFFGPITEREREIRKPLPRRTLHPNEMAQIRESGLTFLEWEARKEQVESENVTCSTGDSFSSCNSEEASKNSMSGVESLCDSWEHAFGVETSNEKEISKDQVSLNDTWEIQERMLLLAEKLERGEDIPELG